MDNALEESIKHWQANLRAEAFAEVSLGRGSCALCARYYDAGYCSDCPVKGRTGHTCCLRTPYQQAVLAYDKWQLSYNHKAFRAAAADMLIFLEGLRE